MCGHYGRFSDFDFLFCLVETKYNQLLIFSCWTLDPAAYSVLVLESESAQEIIYTVLSMSVPFYALALSFSLNTICFQMQWTHNNSFWCQRHNCIVFRYTKLTLQKSNMDDLTRSASSASSSMNQSFSSLKVREPSVETISSLWCSLQDELFVDQKHPQNIVTQIHVSCWLFVPYTI